MSGDAPRSAAGSDGGAGDGDAAAADRAMVAKRNVWVGTAGWSYPDWADIVYPPGASSSFDRLGHLMRFVDVLEINASFYAIPTERSAARWAERAAEVPGFRFTMKLWRGFTHGIGGQGGVGDRIVAPAGEALAMQRRAASLLAEAGALAAVLIQFPYRLRPTRESIDDLARLFDALAGMPLCVEFRHRAWQRDDVLALLRERNVAWCNIDQPDVAQNLGATAIATAPVRYVRMHGRNADIWFGSDTNVTDRYSYHYSAEELAPWLETVRTLGGGAAAGVAAKSGDGGDGMDRHRQLVDTINPFGRAASPKSARGGGRSGEGGSSTIGIGGGDPGGATFLIFNNHGQGQALSNAISAMAALRDLRAVDRPLQAPEAMAARFPHLRDVATIVPDRLRAAAPRAPSSDGQLELF
jgi:uncharacterized protein YecE (DUF72 family)